MIVSPKRNVTISEPVDAQAHQLLEDQRALLTSAIDVRYLREADAVALRMRSGVMLRIPRRLIAELAEAPARTLRSDLALAIGGDAISVRSMDVDISMPGLLRDIFGLNIQRLGGRTKTEATANASKRNGAKGGRPKKATVAS